MYKNIYDFKGGVYLPALNAELRVQRVPTCKQWEEEFAKGNEERPGE